MVSQTRFTISVRIVYGLIFLLFGTNYFLGFFPSPPIGPTAQPFFRGLQSAQYFMPLLHVVYICGGTLLIAGAHVPLMLVLFAPIVVNILAVHLFLDPDGLVLAGLLVILEVFLIWQYRVSFRGLLERKTASYH